MRPLVTYEYTAVVVRVIDGDTVVMDVDLGFHFWRRDQSFRLLGINAREKFDPGGREAKAHLESLLPPGLVVRVASLKADKYGERYDARIILPDTRDLSQVLIETGYAVAWNGTGPKLVPAWPLPAT